MIDLTAYKASKISKIHLSETNALINKPQTLENAMMWRTFVKLDDQIQELLGTMSHHEEESNKPIRDLLNCYESLENYISKFSIAARIYNDKYETNSDDKRVIIVRTKEKLDRNIDTFINDLRQFSKHHFNHDMYEPTLKFESD